MQRDGFEVRSQFTEMLASLSDSKKALGACASYCMKHYEYKLELFDCILSEITDPRSKSLYLKHIVLLLENLCNASLANSWTGFRDLLEQNIDQICRSIFSIRRPLDYHINYVIGLFDVICRRHWLKEDTVKNVRRFINHYLEKCERYTGERPLDKVEFLERIEEERDQQKRLRELLWFFNPQSDPLEEVDEVLESLSDWNPDDEKEIVRERELFERSQHIPPPPIQRLNAPQRSK